MSSYQFCFSTWDDTWQIYFICSPTLHSTAFSLFKNVGYKYVLRVFVMICLGFGVVCDVVCGVLWYFVVVYGV